MRTWRPLSGRKCLYSSLVINKYSNLADCVSISAYSHYLSIKKPIYSGTYIIMDERGGGLVVNIFTPNMAFKFWEFNIANVKTSDSKIQLRDGISDKGASGVVPIMFSFLILYIFYYDKSSGSLLHKLFNNNG